MYFKKIFWSVYKYMEWEQFNARVSVAACLIE